LAEGGGTLLEIERAPPRIVSKIAIPYTLGFCRLVTIVDSGNFICRSAEMATET
jgi:hypothetical protein